MLGRRGQFEGVAICNARYLYIDLWFWRIKMFKGHKVVADFVCRCMRQDDDDGGQSVQGCSPRKKRGDAYIGLSGMRQNVASMFARFAKITAVHRKLPYIYNFVSYRTDCEIKLPTVVD